MASEVVKSVVIAVAPHLAKAVSGLLTVSGIYYFVAVKETPGIGIVGDNTEKDNSINIGAPSSTIINSWLNYRERERAAHLKAAEAHIKTAEAHIKTAEAHKEESVKVAEAHKEESVKVAEAHKEESVKVAEAHKEEVVKASEAHANTAFWLSAGAVGASFVAGVAYVMKK
jgi:hypothetical protein